jgi:hypothetical protein
VVGSLDQSSDTRRQGGQFGAFAIAHEEPVPLDTP